MQRPLSLGKGRRTSHCSTCRSKPGFAHFSEFKLSTTDVLQNPDYPFILSEKEEEGEQNKIAIEAQPLRHPRFKAPTLILHFSEISFLNSIWNCQMFLSDYFRWAPYIVSLQLKRQIYDHFHASHIQVPHLQNQHLHFLFLYKIQ